MSNQKWNNEKLLQLSLRMPEATSSGRPYLYSIIILYYNIVILYLYIIL